MNHQTLSQEAAAEALDAMRLQLDDLNQRIERQQKRVQRIQATSPNAGRKLPKPAAEAQVTLAEMIEKRDALEAELKTLEAAQSGRRV
jgi:hypothetical protein